MKCAAIAEHFRAEGTWVDPERTVDGFKAGDPGREVTKIAVAWKPDWGALKQAHARGAELFVSHESICVRADNTDPSPEVKFALPTEKPKFDWLSETGLVSYRCHDFLDDLPEIGIRTTWREGLELDGKVIVDAPRYFVTEIAPRPLRELAAHVLERVKPLGQNGLLIAGDTEKEVSRIATGTGAITDPAAMFELGADCGVLTEDFLTHVRQGAHARELGFSFVVVNHGVSEEWGVANLAKYLAEKFPELEVSHIPQRCPYTTFTG